MMTTTLPDKIAEFPQAAAQYEQGVESPELAEQVEIEHSILDAWVTFKTTPYLVGRIYSGESLDVDPAEIRDAVIIPELQHQQDVYVEESTAILATQIPALKKRLGAANRELSQADTELDTANAEKEKQYPSPRIVMQIPEVRKRIVRHTKDVADLKGSIHNRQLKVQTNVAVRADIAELLEDPTGDEMGSRVEHITHAAKKAALREVIDVYVQKEALIDGKTVKTEDDEALQAEFLEKIRVLNAELKAMEASDEVRSAETTSETTQDEAEPLKETFDSGEIDVIPTPALDAIRPKYVDTPRFITATRNRMLGGLGAAWSWAGAAWRQK